VLGLLGFGLVLRRVWPGAFKAATQERPWLTACALFVGTLASTGMKRWLGRAPDHGMSMNAAFAIGLGYLAGFAVVFFVAWLVRRARP